VLACTRCGGSNPDRARFCLECGSPLTGSTADGGELRKTVTAVFCDVTGSTALGEHLDPESLRRVMSRYFETMREVLTRHGGTVEKFIGDAVMAVFGVPYVHEDDALRAVRAALEMGRELERVNLELDRSWGARLRVRIGVNTGPVVAGDPASGQMLVTGDAVNVAARLEQAAGPGEVLIGPSTYELVRDAVRAEPFGPLVLKGKAEPITAMRVAEVLPNAAGRSRHLDAPLVGRGSELALLALAFDRVVAQRACHLVTVLGAAGVGKTRLVTEAVGALGERATVLRGECPAYGDGVTFWPVVEAVRQAAGITEADTVEEARPKLTDVLRGEQDEAHLVETLLRLLGLGQAISPLEETTWAVRRLLEALAGRRPVVLVLEDLHWAESSLLDLVDHVADWARRVPVLVVCVSRPELLERRPGWSGGKRNATTIDLPPLAPDDVERLMDHLTGDLRLDAKGTERIVAAAEGIPLFLEEMVAMLLEEGAGHRVADRAITVPPSIQALLAARLDRLGKREGTVIRRASVPGKWFPRGAVEELSPDYLRPSVGEWLQSLTRKDLICHHDTATAGEDEYQFRHMLIRDAAYESLPKAERADLHERFAHWLERNLADRAIDSEELVGHHLEAAYQYRRSLGPVDDRARTNAHRAATALAAAGRRALAREDVAAAANLLSRAADLFDAAEVTEGPVLHDLGLALVGYGRLREASAAFERATAAATAAGDAGLQADVLLSALSLDLQTDPAGTLERADREAHRVIDVLRDMGDDRGLARAHHLLASVEWTRGRPVATQDALERAVAHARAAGDELEEAANLGNLTGVALHGPMPVADGVVLCEQAMAASGTRRSLQGRALRALAGMRAMAGDFGEARELVARSITIFEDLGLSHLLAAAHQEAGLIEALAGDDTAAERAFARSYELLDMEGARTFLAMAAALWAGALHALGRDDEAIPLVDVSRQAAADDDVDTQMTWRAVSARMLAGRGEALEAERLAREAEEMGRSTDLAGYGDVLMDVAATYHRCGRRREAADVYLRARAVYDRKGNSVGAARAARSLARMAGTTDP
jgi:class 3 adenylate cyclase/tetratricopeptide (TPR) repeat protein